MSIKRLSPNLIKPLGASDGDVLSYVAANASVEWTAPSGGASTNSWINSNDYATYTTLQGEYRANDYATYTTLQGEYRANDYATYTSLQANINLVQDNVAALDNNVWVNSNDYATYTTVVGLINTVQDNVSALDNNAWVNSNDYATYNALVSYVDNELANLVNGAPATLDTLNELAAALGNDANLSVSLTNLITTNANNINLVQANLSSLPDSAANDYSTYTTLSTLIDDVQSNLNSIAGSNISSEQFTISTANTFTLARTVSDANNIVVSLDGLVQNPNDDYVVSGNVLSFNNTAPMYAGVDLEVRYLSTATITGAGVVETWEIITSNQSITAGKGYFVDVSSASIGITLPATPTLGDKVRIIDVAGNSEVNNIVVGRNGEKIQRQTTDLTISANSAAFSLIYSNSTYGWILGEV